MKVTRVRKDTRLKSILVLLRPLLLMLILCLIMVFPAFCADESQDELKGRIEALERENQQLRKTVDEQMQLILQLRNEQKQSQRQAQRQTQDDDTEKQTLYSDDRWHGSIGIIGFGLLDSYDHLINTYNQDYDVSGNMYGSRFSLFKGKNGVGGSIYIGEYDFETGNSTDNRQLDENSQRTDIDLAWMHVIRKDERFQLGSLFGVKWLNSEKKLTLRELTTEEDFDSDATWTMGTGGVFISYRLFADTPLFFSGSFNILLGYVEGTVVDTDDNTPDGVINNTFEQDSMSAYGFNGTMGLQYVFLKHLVLGFGYRGQIMNSTDGFMNLDASFYDGHQSVYASLDLAF